MVFEDNALNDNINATESGCSSNLSNSRTVTIGMIISVLLLVVLTKRKDRQR